MGFKDIYTTKTLKIKYPTTVEINKVEITDDSYAICELLECLSNRMVK